MKHRPLLLLGLLWVIVLGWLAARSDDPKEAFGLTGHQRDYYNSLVEGFRQGHLSLNQAVDPDLLSPDPQVRHRAAYLLDAALFEGRYYLYYGVVPAVTLLLPYSLLTGQEMGLEVACWVFIGLGVMASLAWIARLPPRREGGQGLGLACLAALLIVPGTSYLADRGAFYELPIAAGYAFACLFWLCAERLRAEPGRTGWLAGASLCFGLMVGCRPNLIFYAPILVWLGLSASGWRARAGHALAGILPAALVGAGLAWYNFARFHSVTDFGFNHGVNAFFERGNPIASARFVWANLRWYLLTAPRLLPHFPFVFPIDSGAAPAGYSNTEAMQGFVTASAVGLLVALGLVVRRGKAAPQGDGRGSLAMALGFAALIELVFVCSLGIRASRYAVEFLTPAAYLLVLGIRALWRPGLGGAAFKAALALLLGAMALEDLLGSVQQFDRFASDRPDTYRRLSLALNPHQRLAEWLGAPKAGPVEFHLTFHKVKDTETITLLKTGVAGYADALRVIVYPWGYLTVDMVHDGYGAYPSDLIPITFEKPYMLRATMGSLYPGGDDPYWKGVEPSAVDRLTHLGVAWLDGRPVLSFERPFFPGTPAPRRVGPLTDPEGGPTDAVSVHDLQAGGEIPPALLRPRVYPPAAYQLGVLLPPVSRSRALPLLCSGTTHDGALLFIDPVPHQRYRLGLDRWGRVPAYSPQFDVANDRPTQFKVLVGPQIAHDPRMAGRFTPAERARLAHTYLLWVNDAYVGSLPVAEPLDLFKVTVVGKNKVGFSTACDDIGAIEVAPEGEALCAEMAARARAVLGQAPASRARPAR